MDEPLGPLGCRLIGCLVEKEATVPATYPLTLKAVISAANQSSGRDPVMDVGPVEAELTLDRLRELGLIRRVHASHGARVVKYRHVINEVLGLDEPKVALLAVLLLRGPQTPGELRTRSQRIHDFDSTDNVLDVLRSLAEVDDALVLELDRQPGQKEQRWAHLLDGPVDVSASQGSRTVSESAKIEIGPEIAPLADFVGHWVGTGHGSYPTIESFDYIQQVEFLPIPGKPLLSYRSATRHAEDNRPLHAESGYLRCIDSEGGIEFVVAQGSGIVEIAEGVVIDGEMILTSTMIGGSTTAKEVASTDRRYNVDGDSLMYNIAMAAVGEPLTHHLLAELRRS